jgi:regulatory protein
MESNPLKPVKSILFKLLAKRDHSRKELYIKLKKIGYAETEINETLDEAQNQGFINDERLTENYIHYRSQYGYGPCRIEAELNEKGICAHLIGAQMPDETCWQVLAQKAREKRFGKEIPLMYAEKCKQMRFLQYRGFKLEQIITIFNLT